MYYNTLERKEYNLHLTPTSWAIWCQLQHAPSSQVGFPFLKWHLHAACRSPIHHAHCGCCLRWCFQPEGSDIAALFHFQTPFASTSNGLKMVEIQWKSWHFTTFVIIYPFFLLKTHLPGIPSPPHPTTKHLWVGGTQLPWSWWQGWPVSTKSYPKMRWLAEKNEMKWQDHWTKISDSIIYISRIFFRLSEDDLQQTQIWGS